MEIELCETGTNNDLETVGIVKTDCKTVGEFANNVEQRWKKARIEVGGVAYHPEMNERKIENIFYTDGWGGLVFTIKTKIDFTMNEKNLIPNSERTPSELKEITRKGGIASGEARRKKKRLSQLLDMMFEKASKSPDYETIADELIGKAIAKELQDPNFETIKKAQDILGESISRHEITTSDDFEKMLDERLKNAGYK